MHKQGESSLVWRKSTYSGSESACVEVADNLPGSIFVRDSKNVDIQELAFSSAEWTRFMDHVKTSDRGASRG